MTDKQLQPLEELLAEIQEELADIRGKFLEDLQGEYRALAFVIHRFCGGKIDYTVDEISAVSHRDIDILRTYRDGRTPARSSEPAAKPGKRSSR